MDLLLMTLITIVPIALWGLYFYFRNPRRQKIAEVFKIFALGTLSVVPVLIFHQHFLNPATDFILYNTPIPDVSIVLSILQLVLMTIFIILFMVIFALIHSFIFHTVYRHPWRESFGAVYKKIYNLTPLLIFFILFLLAELVYNYAFDLDFMLSLTGSVITFAVLEEYFKYIIIPFLTYRRINSIGEAIINTLYVGLAFSFVENILFFLANRGSEDFLAIYVYRSIFTTLLHVCASGLLGYFYGLTLFSNAIITNYEIEKSRYDMLAWLRKKFGLGKKSIFQSISITQGFFIAALVHAAFNLLLLHGYRNLSAALIIILSFLIVYLLNIKSTQIQYGLIGTPAMPKADFEKLRLKVSVLSNLNQIQKQQQGLSSDPQPNSQPKS